MIYRVLTLSFSAKFDEANPVSNREKKLLTSRHVSRQGLGALFVAMTLSGGISAAEIYGDARGVYVTEFPQGAQSLRIRGPQGFMVKVDALEYRADEPLAAGRYRYEVLGPIPGSAAPIAPDATTNIENGRSPNAVPGVPAKLFTSGSFRIDDKGDLVTLE
jgi:hypothetical protein